MSLQTAYHNIIAQEAENLRRDALYLARLAVEFYEMGESNVARIVLKEAVSLAHSRRRLLSNLNDIGGDFGELLALLTTLEEMVTEGEPPHLLREFLASAS